MEKFSANSLLNSYFNTTEIELGENQPKLAKQLKKLNISASELEVKFWGEVVAEIVNLAILVGPMSYEGNPCDYEFPVEFSDKLPDFEEQDRWAFNSSCNNSEDCGKFTSLALQTYEGSRYCYIYDADDYPTARFYYFEQDGEFCVADWYRKGNHGEYNTALALMLVHFGYKWEDIDWTKDEVGNLYNEGGFWSNFASPSVRKYYSPGFVFADVEFGELEDLGLEALGMVQTNSGEWLREEDAVYSDEYGDYLERDCAVYADNISDWVHEDDSNLTTCMSCGNPVHLSCNYIEANGDEHFCDRACLENYFDIVEY